MLGILEVQFFEFLPIQREKNPALPGGMPQHLVVSHGKPILACIPSGLHIVPKRSEAFHHRQGEVLVAVKSRHRIGFLILLVLRDSPCDFSRIRSRIVVGVHQILGGQRGEGIQNARLGDPQLTRPNDRPYRNARSHKAGLATAHLSPSFSRVA